MNKRLDELLELQRDRQLAPAQQADLERWLAEDPAAAQQWAATQAFDRRLVQALGTQLDSAQLHASAAERMRAQLRQPRRGRRVLALAAVCAALAVLIMAWAVARNLSGVPATVAPPAEGGAQQTAQAAANSRATVQAIYAANETARADFYATETARPGAAEEATARAIAQATSDAWTPTPTRTNSEATATARIDQSSAEVPTATDVQLPATMTTEAITGLTATALETLPAAIKTATADIVMAEQTATALVSPQTPMATPDPYAPPPSPPPGTGIPPTPTPTATPTVTPTADGG